MAQLSDKTILVTGATSGMGPLVALDLARMGAEVVMVARDEKRGEAALAEVRSRSGSQAISLMRCDFASQADIRKLASDFCARHARLDVLVNNAGSVSATRQLTVDGLEQTFAVNHLGYFLLTNLLLDLLERSAPSRVVNVASVAHRRGDIDFENLEYERGGYAIMKAYARSKLANVLFTAELARRLAGKSVTVTCLHPGTVATNIWSRAPWFARPLLAVAKRFMLRPEEGARAIVHLATSPDLEKQTGGYYEKGRRVNPSPSAQDEALAKRLWEESSKLVKLA
ncbi:MAG: short-chain dehydrogenase [Anaeromyxobacter sp. RBG_16_69_14]|nr:MAG: short-chain dehydrogenase [Anaeromyxobacter sp. RBG_16_69_14]